MHLLTKLLGKQPIPEWAGGFSEEDYKAFLDLVRDYFRARALHISLKTEVGSVFLEDGRHELNLRNLAQVCRANRRERWRDIVATHFQHLFSTEREWQDLAQKRSGFSEVAGLIAVRLWPAGTAEAVGAEHVVYREDLEATLSALVFDLPTTIQNVQPHDVAAWGVSTAELFELGLKYVREKCIPEVSTVYVDNEVRFTVLSGENFLTASHVLLLEQHPECLGPYGALVGVPRRSQVICYPIQDATVVKALAKLMPIVHGAFRDGPGSVSPLVYLYRQARYTSIPFDFEKKTMHFPPAFTDLLNDLARDGHTLSGARSPS